MNIRRQLSEIHSLLFIKLTPYMLHEYWRFTKYMARCQMSKKSNKLMTEIMMTTHAIEKAFSLVFIRKGFGIQKIELLARNIHKYIQKYGYSDELDIPISLVFYYLDFQSLDGFIDSKLSKVKSDMNIIIEQIHKTKDEFLSAGHITVSRKKMWELTNINFKVLAEGRHSFRHFGLNDVSDELIRNALDIAKNSPSACNRQAYRVHVFKGEEKDLILQLQGGANSFYKEVNKAILITGDLNRYYSTEMHLPYVDASLFAMSLMYAFTSLGIASIPLTMGRKLSILRDIPKKLSIPLNETPVILIAIGEYPEEASLSKSERNSITSFTTFH
ncbi:hypothetical protein F020042I8_33160 [Bacteroides xylanisolvens]|uniref:nitroreductase family protein n=1 Tax=Bacteroides xylanisolvens TaxID=371601 RepID=UPI0036F3E258